MKRAITLLLIGFLAYLVFYILVILYYIFRSGIIAIKTRAFERSAGKLRFGIFGDSTALGVGASRPEKSLAGLLAKQLPESTVTNYAKNYLFIGQVAKMLEKQQSFDLLLICCGGNDILFLKNLHQIEIDIQKLLTVASSKGKKIILVTPLNLSFSPVIPWFAKTFYYSRSKLVGQMFNQAAMKFSNIFLLNNLEIGNLNAIPPWPSISAPDRIHPNDEGYRLVFEKIKMKGL